MAKFLSNAQSFSPIFFPLTVYPQADEDKQFAYGLKYTSVESYEPLHLTVCGQIRSEEK